MTWKAGDTEPHNADVRQVRGRSGTVWCRSEPAGLFWYPRSGGPVASWQDLLAIDGPATDDRSVLPLTLFDLPERAA